MQNSNKKKKNFIFALVMLVHKTKCIAHLAIFICTYLIIICKFYRSKPKNYRDSTAVIILSSTFQKCKPACDGHHGTVYYFFPVQNNA